MSEQDIETANEDLTKDLYRLLQLKARKAEIEHEIEFIQTQLADLFDKVQFEVDNRQFKAKVMRSETFDVDLGVLKAEAPELYSKVTKQILDKSAFNRIVTNGGLETDLANKIIAIKPRKPWLSITEVTDTEEETDE